MMLKPRGCNSSGHKGWYEVKCRICAKKIYLGDDIIYYCPKCAQKYDAYFCLADAKRVYMRCPYCEGELQLFIQTT
uniref:Uncharacterized protein n=1 Tax=Ignisphaera aggregans TaxID=334771 RepID=A0A7C5USE8_9CREN